MPLWTPAKYSVLISDDWLNPPYKGSSNQDSAFCSTTDPVLRDEGDPCPPSISASDFRFTYAGPSGTFTPLHRDVYASYSWSANIVGRKVWWLFPPEKVGRLLQSGGGELPFDVRDLYVGVEEDLGALIVLQEVRPSFQHHIHVFFLLRPVESARRCRG